MTRPIVYNEHGVMISGIPSPKRRTTTTVGYRAVWNCCLSATASNLLAASSQGLVNDRRMAEGAGGGPTARRSLCHLLTSSPASLPSPSKPGDRGNLPKPPLDVLTAGNHTRK